jgi:hypothetical protein
VTPRKAFVLGAGGGSVVGVGVGSLTSHDASRLFEKIIDGTFKFLEQQGSYASFAIILAGGFGWLTVWCIKQLINSKQAEIDRIAANRDKFQQLVIERWESSAVAVSAGGKKK